MAPPPPLSAWRDSTVSRCKAHARIISESIPTSLDRRRRGSDFVDPRLSDLIGRPSTGSVIPRTPKRMVSAPSAPAQRPGAAKHESWISDTLYGRPQHAVGAEALPRNCVGLTGISRAREPVGGVASLGGPHFLSPVVQDRSPKAGVRDSRAEDTEAAGVSFSGKRQQSGPRRCLSARDTGHRERRNSSLTSDQVKSLWTKQAERCQSPPPAPLIAPFATDAQASPFLSGRDTPRDAQASPLLSARRASLVSWSPDDPSKAVSVSVPAGDCTSAPGCYIEEGAASSVPAGARRARGESVIDFTRLAEEKLESWKLFKQRHQQDLAQMLDAARGSAADPGGALPSEAAAPVVEEPLFPWAVPSAGGRVPERRRDFACPVRAAPSTDLGHQKEIAVKVINPEIHPVGSPLATARSLREPAQTTPTRPYTRASLVMSRKSQSANRGGAKALKEFKPVSRILDSPTSTRASDTLSTPGRESAASAKRTSPRGCISSTPRGGARNEKVVQWRG